MNCDKKLPSYNGFVKKLFRRKVTLNKSENDGDLSRCLTTFDLTNLGIGSILGAGIYVVVGQVAAEVAGPSVFLSVIIAAFTSLLSGLCYAEFGSRVPRTTGSAYSYSYHTVGEIIAFIIGWNLILEYMIGTAADARALSGAIDYLLDHRISNFSFIHFGRVPVTGATLDIMGFLLTLSVTLVLAAGVKESARYTVFFNVLTGAVAVFIIIAGSVKSNPAYWQGTHNFFPKGVHGVLSGAATCFYAFVGYDIIATTGEEAKSPSRSIPLAISLTLLICLVMYLGVATVLTMMVPFRTLVSDSPITEAFDRVGGMHWVKWIVGLGGCAGMSASLMGSEFPLPRIIYAMSSDGLMFKCFNKIWSRTEVPIFATLIPGIITAFFTMLFDLGELVEMMSIGTLLAYSLVCTSILLLRYQFDENNDHEDLDNSREQLQSISVHKDSDENAEEDFYIVNNSDIQDSDTKNLIEDTNTEYSNGISSPKKAQTISILPNKIDSSPSDLISTSNYCIFRPWKIIDTQIRYKFVIFYVSLTWIFGFCMALVTLFGEDQLINRRPVALGLFLVFLSGLIFCSGCLCAMPQNTKVTQQLHFKVPFVPVLPIVAIVSNLILMLRLSSLTWIRFSVWMAIGFLLYFGYGIRHSKLSNPINKYSYSKLSEIINNPDEDDEEAILFEGNES